MSGRKISQKKGTSRRAMGETLFAELRDSVRQGGAVLRGTVRASGTYELTTPTRRPARGGSRAVLEHANGTPDVGALRARFRLSRAKFAAMLGISPATLRNWEQRRRVPEGPARVLLRVAARHPDAVLSAVAAAPGGRDRFET